MLNFLKSLASLGPFSKKAKERQSELKMRAALSVHNGGDLTPEEADKYERILLNKPDNLDLRGRLLGYYTYNRFQKSAFNKERARHALWVIEHIPEHPLANDECTNLHKEDEGYERGKELWLQHVQKKKSNLVILEHAAEYLTAHDKDYAEQLLKQAKNIQPFNHKWPSKLSYLYALEYASSSNLKHARKALKEMERAYGLARNFGLSEAIEELTKLPELAYYAENCQSARTYAYKLLRKCSNCKSSYEKSEAVHASHTILGLIAMKDNNIELSEEHLLKSAFKGYDDSLSLVTPKIELVSTLLENGSSTDVVLEFLDLGKNRFKAHKLEEWTKCVESGEIPQDWQKTSKRR